jgi:hypothetical protein
MINTTITVSDTFPIKAGEVIKIKNSNGKGIWREYHVGKKSGEDKDAKTVTHRARMKGSIL